MAIHHRVIHHLKNMRQHPHHVKRRWLVALTIIVMALVLTVWLINLRTFLRIPPPVTASGTSASQ